MANKIKGITLEIGGDVQPLEKALASVNKKSKDLQTELKSVERLLKFDPGNTELLAQKQKLLAAQVENSKDKLLALKRAQEQVNQAFQRGDLGEEQYRHFSRQVINAEQDLNKFKRELKQVGTTADNTKRDLGELGGKLDDVGGKMSMGITLPVVGGTFALTEGTREMRLDLAALDTNAKNAGVSIDQIREKMTQMYAVTGETDSNMEGLSELLATGFKGDDLDQLVMQLAGASIKFKDTLKFEGIADGLQETLATGKSIGPFDELLSRSGVNLDNWNAGLTQAIANGTQYQYVLDTLASLGLPAVYEEYKKTNQAVVDSQAAHFEMQQSMAELADQLEPIVTKAVQALTKLLDMFNSMPEGGKNMILVIVGVAAVIGPLLMTVAKAMIFFELFGGKLGGVTKIAGPLINIVSKIGPLLAGLASGPVGWAVIAITSLIAIFVTLYKTSDRFKAWVDGLVVKLKDGFGDMVSWATVKLNQLIDLINNIPGVDVNYVYDSKTMGIAGEKKRSHFASGTSYAPGGLAWVGERGPELIDLPKGSKVYTNQQSMAMMGGSQNLNVSGEILVRGVNDRNQFVGVTELLASELARDIRRWPSKTAALPSRA